MGEPHVVHVPLKKIKIAIAFSNVGINEEVVLARKGYMMLSSYSSMATPLVSGCLTFQEYSEVYNFGHDSVWGP